MRQCPLNLQRWQRTSWGSARKKAGLVPVQAPSSLTPLGPSFLRYTTITPLSHKVDGWVPARPSCTLFSLKSGHKKTSSDHSEASSFPPVSVQVSMLCMILPGFLPPFPHVNKQEGMGGEIPGRLAARRESRGADRVQSCPTCHHISQQLLLLADFPPGYSPQLAFMQLQDAYCEQCPHGRWQDL